MNKLLTACYKLAESNQLTRKLATMPGADFLWINSDSAKTNLLATIGYNEAGAQVQLSLNVDTQEVKFIEIDRPDENRGTFPSPVS